MTFLERNSEMRRLQLMKDIATEAEEQAIREVLKEERQDEIKQETTIKLEPSVPSLVPKLRLYEPQDTRVKESFDKKPAVAVQIDENAATFRELLSLQEKHTELRSMLVKQNELNHLPVKEPPVFSGDPFDYPAFTTAFDSIISANVPSNKDRLYFLEKYTKGKANDIVKGFLCLSSESAYDEARKLLNQWFGNPVHVAEAYKTRMRNWPQINDGDSGGLQDFSDFLVRCQEAVKTVGSLAELNSTQTLRQISAKLPPYSAVKWCNNNNNNNKLY